MDRASRACLIAFVFALAAAQAAAQHVFDEATTTHKHARMAQPFAAPASKASPNFDAIYYELRLDIDTDQESIDGEARIVGLADGEALTTLELDLSSSLTVSRVSQAGSERPFRHRNDVLAIDLLAEVPSGETVDVRVEYSGTPDPSGFGSFVFESAASRPAVWSLSEPYGARDWWPGKDHPSDKADSLRLLVTVPEDLRVASNGLLKSDQTHNGRATYEWMHRYPIAPYLVSIAVGPYAVFEQTYERPDSLVARHGPLALPVIDYVYDRGDEVGHPYPNWQAAVDMLAVFEHWFGPYPFPEEKYGHAEFGWLGGMEHQTMSSMGGSSIMLVAHELAHQWYGNAVTLHTWPHLWLNEGFASYGELLYWEAREDRYPGQFALELDVDMQRARNAPGTLVVQDTLNINNLFNANRVYAKGSVVLHMLRRMVGDETFRAILHAYASDPDLQYGTAVTDDFRRIAEGESGRDLSTFFRQWVTEGTGYPRYEVSWRFDEEDDHAINVTIHQTQTEAQSNIHVFEMPVTVEVETQSGHERFIVQNDARAQDFRLELADRPIRLRFDPDGDLLRNEDVTVTHASRSSGHKTAITALFPNPAADNVHMRFALGVPGDVRLALYDVSGRRLLEEAIVLLVGEHERSVDVSGLAAGAYFLELSIDGERQIRPLIVVNP